MTGPGPALWLQSGSSGQARTAAIAATPTWPPAMLPCMPRVSEVLPVPRIGRPAAEKDIQTTCPSCGRVQLLSNATYDDGDELESVYGCRICSAPILIVSTPGVIPWEGRGYRIGDWMIRNPREVLVFLPDATQPVLFEASEHALD